MPNTLLGLLKFQNIHDLINVYTYIYAEKSDAVRTRSYLNLFPFCFGALYSILVHLLRKTVPVFSYSCA